MPKQPFLVYTSYSNPTCYFGPHLLLFQVARKKKRHLAVTTVRVTNLLSKSHSTPQGTGVLLALHTDENQQNRS